MNRVGKSLTKGIGKPDKLAKHPKIRHIVNAGLLVYPPNLLTTEPPL